MEINKKTIEKIKTYFAGKPEVAAVYLYGSFSRGTENKFSDLDIGVVSKKLKDPIRFRIKYISDLTSILEFEDVDVQILGFDGSLPLNFRALKEGSLIYEKNKKERVNFETKTLNLYFDFYPVLERYYQSMEKRIKEGTYAS